MDLTNIIKIPVELNNKLNKNINDTALELNNSELSCEKEFNTKTDIFSFSFNVNASAKMTILNGNNNEDDLTNYTSPITNIIGEGEALIRYDLKNHLSEAFAGAFKAINANFKAEQDIILSSYRVHHGSEKAYNAIINDLASLKNIYSDNDIFSLNINEGLAVAFSGSLDAGIKLSYSDIYSGTLSQLAKTLPKEFNISGSVEASASISFSITIDDEFKLFIQRIDNDKYVVNIKKARLNAHGIAIEAKIKASLNENEQSFTVLVNNLLTALLGQPVDKINSWVNKGITKLSTNEQALLTNVIQRIVPIEDISLNDDLVQEIFNNYKTSIIEKSKEILSKKLEAGVSYEYKKSTQTNTVFKATIRKQALKENLKSILLMKVNELYNNPNIETEEYIFSKTKSITKKLGFQLAFGDFKAHWSNTQSYKFDFKKDYKKDTNKICFSGKYVHEHGAKNQKKWYFELSGQTLDSVKTPVKMNDLAYSAIVHWEDQQRKIDAFELSDFVEMGMFWNCINEDFDTTCRKIFAEINDKKDVKFSCEISIPAPEMKNIIQLISESTSKDTINSLCNAMPHYSNKYRKNLDNLIVYSQLWKLYLDKRGKGSTEKYAEIAYNTLLPIDKQLANWELEFEDGISTHSKLQGKQSFIGLIDKCDLADDIKFLHRGMKYLNKEIENNSEYDEKIIHKAFNDIDDLVTSKGQNKTFNITFLGRYILDIAKNHNLIENISARMFIKYKNKEDQPVEMVFIRNR